MANHNLTRTRENTSKEDKRRLEQARVKAERIQFILSQRVGGASYEQIGRKLGISPIYVFRMFQDEIKRLERQRTESLNAVIQLELQRLDALTGAFLSKALGIGRHLKADGTPSAPDAKAAGIVLQSMQRRAMLLGLDAPQRIRGETVNVNANIDAGGDGKSKNGPTFIDLLQTQGVKTAVLMKAFYKEMPHVLEEIDGQERVAAVLAETACLRGGTGESEEALPAPADTTSAIGEDGEEEALP